MHDGERLVAERDVVVRGHHVMSVRISEHPAEGFWRLDLSNPAAHRATMTTTVSETDSFLMHLISDAVGGQPSAWRGLAECGQDHLSRPAPGFRLAPAG